MPHFPYSYRTEIMNSIFIVIPILVVLMFLLGTGLNRKAFIGVAKAPRGVIAGMTGQLILLPAIAFFTACILDLQPVYFMGLILVACCPGGSSSNVFTMLARGNVALSVTLTALSSIITLFTLPVIMAYTARFVSMQSGEAIELPIGKLIMQNIVLLFVPILLGVALRKASPEAARKVNSVLGKCAFPALMTLALVFFLQYTQEIIDNIAILGSAAALLILLAMAFSSLLSRATGNDTAVRRTIVIEVGMQNAAQAIAIATSPIIFNSGEMALPAIIYALLMNIILLLYVFVIRKRTEKE